MYTIVYIWLLFVHDCLDLTSLNNQIKFWNIYIYILYLIHDLEKKKKRTKDDETNENGKKEKKEKKIKDMDYNRRQTWNI